MRHTKTLGIVEVDNSVWKRLTDEKNAENRGICEEKLKGFYSQLEAK